MISVIIVNVNRNTRQLAVSGIQMLYITFETTRTRKIPIITLTGTIKRERE